MANPPIQILLVEDDADHAELIRLGFETREEMALTVARSLEEARAHLGSSLPGALILDSLLPDGRGLDLLPGDGRQLPYPVMLLTSHGDEAMKKEAMAIGVSEYVVKSETTLLELPDIAMRALERWQPGA